LSDIAFSCLKRHDILCHFLLFALDLLDGMPNDSEIVHGRLELLLYRTRNVGFYRRWSRLSDSRYLVWCRRHVLGN